MTELSFGGIQVRRNSILAGFKSGGIHFRRAYIDGIRTDGIFEGGILSYSQISVQHLNYPLFCLYFQGMTFGTEDRKKETKIVTDLVISPFSKTEDEDLLLYIDCHYYWKSC